MTPHAPFRMPAANGPWTAMAWARAVQGTILPAVKGGKDREDEP
jgi:hypothetical protein